MDYVYMALFAIVGCWVRITLGNTLVNYPQVTSKSGVPRSSKLACPGARRRARRACGVVGATMDPE